jgi:hypothetical protein
MVVSIMLQPVHLRQTSDWPHKTDFSPEDSKFAAIKILEIPAAP